MSTNILRRVYRSRYMAPVRKLKNKYQSAPTKPIELNGKAFYAPTHRQLKIAKKYIEGSSDFYEGLLAICNRENSVILDVGANMGYTAILFTRLAPKAYVIAFEPYKPNSVYLNKNVLNYNKIQVCNYAITSKSEMVPLGFPEYIVADKKRTKDDKSNTGRISAKGISNDSESAQVYSAIGLTLDNYVNTIPDQLHIDFIKIDVEGLESEVLAGSDGVISKHRPIIQLECNPRTNDYKELFASLEGVTSAHNYQLYEYCYADAVPPNELERVKEEKIQIEALLIPIEKQEAVGKVPKLHVIQ